MKLVDLRQSSGLHACAVAIGLVLGLGAAPAMAAPELITNGNFSSFTVNGAASNTSYIVSGGQTSGSGGATLTGWSNSGYTFVFTPGTASSTGAVVSPGTNLTLWGPDGAPGSASYSNNGLTTSPTGGNFVAEDGSYQQGYLYQTINNLKVGQSYQLSYYWAAAQQAGYTGDTTEAWTTYWLDANLGYVASASTQTVTTPSKGFTPWRQQINQFVATTTSMTLAFIAVGTPGGSPPFSLLDGVSLTAVPEPATWAVLIAGLAGVTAVRLRRRAAGQVARPCGSRHSRA